MEYYLKKLANQQSLSKDEMSQAIKLILTEKITESEVAALIFGLKMKGETVDEIVGIVDAITTNEHSYQSLPYGVIDNCGTGGDNSGSFNISTTSAFVIAGANIPVAKHGNRSISSESGSADVLEQLGVNLYLNKTNAINILNKIGLTFLFAPFIHKTFQKVTKVRQALRIPTVFNLIGPLTNPVKLQYQLIGMYDRNDLLKFAKVLQQLDRKRAILINGAGGIDEASLAGENYLVIADPTEIKEQIIHPNQLGLPLINNEKIKGGTAKENSEILLSVLHGIKSPYYYTVLLNSAIGIYAANKADSIAAGLELAKQSIQSGAAFKKLQQLINESNCYKSEVI